MRRSYPLWFLIAAALIFGPAGWRMLTWQRFQPQVVVDELAQEGKILFIHEWEANDPLCSDGNGLGPVYNAKSCAACHHQGGIGGSGGVEHNVTTFLVKWPNGAPKAQGVIHAFATSAEHQETLALVDRALPAISQPTLAQITPRDPMQRLLPRPNAAQPFSIPNNVELSQLNTPALSGAGLIDSIPERAIIANAHQQKARNAMRPAGDPTMPVGRVARLADGRIGRFGWKARIASLSDFVQTACANELGLGNPGHAEPQSLAMPGLIPGSLDLTQMQCDQLTAFVAALPRPVERSPEGPGRPTKVHTGKVLFSKIGCADCHTPSLGSVDGLYSDLLLHRMGSELQGGNGSYGGSTPTPTAPGNTGSIASAPLPDEWRTPPLWGVADSAPYMHDGRAATLEEAIQLHGGQGAAAAERFQVLKASEKEQIIAFLRSLRVS
jgi:CxxC motif-containing protein (DUF1111 family)